MIAQSIIRRTQHNLEDRKITVCWSSIRAVAHNFQMIWLDWGSGCSREAVFLARNVLRIESFVKYRIDEYNVKGNYLKF